MKSPVELRRESKTIIIIGALIATIGMIVGVISTTFPTDVGNAIGIPALIVCAIGAITLIVGARKHRHFRYVRNDYFARRDSTYAFNQEERVKINLLVESSKGILKGQDNITRIFEYASTREPVSQVYFRYRLKPADLEKIYKSFSSLNYQNLFDYENYEYLPYSVFLFELPFSVMALFIKDCVRTPIEELVNFIHVYYKTNDSSDLKRIIAEGTSVFEDMYRRQL